MGWFTSNDASTSSDTGTPQTDTYFGETGESDHGHVAHDHDGNFVYGRDTDGSAITADQVTAAEK